MGNPMRDEPFVGYYEQRDLINKFLEENDLDYVALSTYLDIEHELIVLTESEWTSQDIFEES